MGLLNRPGVVGSALLAITAASTLANDLVILAAEEDACLDAFPLFSPLGVHLDLLAVSKLCPLGTYALGEVGRRLLGSLAVVSVVFIVVSLLAMVASMGAGMWVRNAVDTARQWVSRLLASAPYIAGPCLPPRTAARAGSVWVSRFAFETPQRRGPPATA